MKPDIEKYRAFVDGFDLSETERVELIHMIWRLMESLADQAFGLGPVALAADDKFASEKHKPLSLSLCYCDQASGALTSTQTTTARKD